MATIRKRRGRWNVSVRRKGHRAIYETFDKISDARSFVNKVESDIQQMKYKDISEAANTSLRTILHRYIREKLQRQIRQEAWVIQPLVSGCLVNGTGQRNAPSIIYINLTFLT